MPVFSSGGLKRKPPKLDFEARCGCRARGGAERCTANHRTGLRVQRSYPTGSNTSRIRRESEALAPRRCHGWQKTALVWSPLLSHAFGGMSAGKEIQGSGFPPHRDARPGKFKWRSCRWQRRLIRASLRPPNIRLSRMPDRSETSSRCRSRLSASTSSTGRRR